MMYSKLKYQSKDAILATRPDGSMVLIENDGGELWQVATSGALGKVAAYIPPPEPTEKEKREQWRGVAHCDMIELQDWLIDNRLDDKAEGIVGNLSRKFSNRWAARGGVPVLRAWPAVDKLFFELGYTPEKIDDLPFWRPRRES